MSSKLLRRGIELHHNPIGNQDFFLPIVDGPGSKGKKVKRRSRYKHGRQHGTSGS